MSKFSIFISFFLLSVTAFSQVDSIHQQKKISKQLIQPSYLKKGDTILILAPAGILKKKKEIIGKAKGGQAADETSGQRRDTSGRFFGGIKDLMDYHFGLGAVTDDD